MQFMVQGAWGVIPAHLSELSPDSVRGFLPGFAYQCGVLLASSVAYIEALLAERFSYASAMASPPSWSSPARRWRWRGARAQGDPVRRVRVSGEARALPRRYPAPARVRQCSPLPECSSAQWPV